MLPTRLDENLESILKEEVPWTELEEPIRCKEALEFFNWTEKTLSQSVLGRNTKLLTILLAKAILTDRYRFFRRQADKRCRDKVSKRGHECIFQVWDNAYKRLEEIEGRLPELLYIPELQLLKELREEDDDQPFATLAALQEQLSEA